MSSGQQYDMGSVTVTAEVHDTDMKTVTGYTDITGKYGHLRDEPKEHVYAVFLNGANETLAEKLIGLGTAAEAGIDITDIARTAILTNARAVILIHNHPSGDATASSGDVTATKAVQDALSLFNIDLLDHVIIGRDQHHSMRRNHDLQFTGGEA